MALITWTAEQYGTGVDVPDEQHKTLFDMLNALHDAISGNDRPIIGERLDTLINFVVEHFQTEETLMQEKGYDGYEAHKAEHDKLIKTCAEIQKGFHAGNAEVTQDTTVFIKEWLDGHIPKIDMPYASVLNS